VEGTRCAASLAPPSVGYDVPPEAFVVVVVVVDADGGGWGGAVGARHAVVGVGGWRLWQMFIAASRDLVVVVHAPTMRLWPFWWSCPPRFPFSMVGVGVVFLGLGLVCRPCVGHYL
jgi:hypothetical protein